MKTYEYRVMSPNIEQGQFIDGYDKTTTKGFLGKEKTKYKEVTISEIEWLNRLGAEGWELVGVLRNGMSYDIRDYYFKREVNI